MPNFLGRTDFNVGQDVSVSIDIRGYGRFSADELGHLTDIDVDFDDKEVMLHPITGGGRPLNQSIPHGVTGRMQFARFNGQLGRILTDQQRMWYEDGRQLRADIQVQIRNRDTSVDTYLLRNCSFQKGKLLGAKGDKEIEQGFSFRGTEVVPT